MRCFNHPLVNSTIAKTAKNTPNHWVSVNFSFRKIVANEITIRGYKAVRVITKETFPFSNAIYTAIEPSTARNPDIKA